MEIALVFILLLAGIVLFATERFPVDLVAVMVTVAEVSERTGFTAGAVRGWIKRSILPAVKVGREFRGERPT